MAKIVYLKEENKYVWFSDNDYEIDSDGKPVYNYFVDGEGWKKTKSFTILEDSELPIIPDRWGEQLSNLRIMEITDKYGKLIGEKYMEPKITSVHPQICINVLYSIYEKINPLLNSENEIDVKFFELLDFDHNLAGLEIYFFSPVTTNKNFSKNDPEYDGENCTYKGRKGVSMKDYVREKFGQKYVDIIEILYYLNRVLKNYK